MKKTRRKRRLGVTLSPTAIKDKHPEFAQAMSYMSVLDLNTRIRASLITLLVIGVITEKEYLNFLEKRV